MKYNFNQLLKKIIFISVISILVMILILSFNNIKEIFSVIKTANMQYLLYGFIALILYFLIYPLTLCILSKAKGTNISFKYMFLIGATEYFFNGITPFSSGGQPFQAYSLNEFDVKPSESTGLLLMNFLIMQLVINIFSALALILYFNYVSNMKVLIIIGFAVNIIILILIIGLGTMNVFRNGIMKLLIILCKIKFIGKYLEYKIPSFEKYCLDSQAAFIELSKFKKTFIFCLFIKFVSLIFFYSIPFFILKALHVNIGYNQLAFIIGMTSFALTIVTWFPTPGASGGIELAFKTLFIEISGVTSTVAFGGMLLWRLFTYYLLMIISFIAYLFVQKSINKYQKKAI